MARNRRKVVIRIEPDWNVKFIRTVCINPLEIIRIEPDWNVKIENGTSSQAASNIRIEPDWNVKYHKCKSVFMDALLE